MSTRVGVVGLGVVGAMTAWRLAERGASVTGFEQYAVAHDRGASAGQTRRLARPPRCARCPGRGPGATGGRRQPRGPAPVAWKTASP